VTATSTAPEAVPDARTGVYPTLDGLRAVAVLCVVLTHVGFQTGETLRGSLGNLLARFDFGVTLFFLLSGFLLYGPFVRAQLAEQPMPSTSGYLRNRGLRVLPGYWVAVAVVMPVMASHYLHPVEVLRQVLLLQVYRPNHLVPGLTQMWSLCAEVVFYLALPLLALGARRLARRDGGVLRAQAWLLGAMVVASVLWTLSTRGLEVPDPIVGGLWFPAYLDWFALGMGLAVLRAWHDTTGRGRVLDQLADASGTCWAIGALLLWLTVTPIGGPLGLSLPTPGQALTKHLLYGAAASFLLLPAVFGTTPTAPVRRLLESRVARWGGRISYGVFLWHLLVLDLVFKATGIETFTGRFWLIAVLTIPASAAVAALSLRLVEQPALRLKRRWATAGR
jgi:peptidoglycan/LPS O-acetylase OafA/YrhL